MRTQFGTIHLKTYLCGALLLGAGLLPATAMAQDPASASPATSTKADDPTLSQVDADVDPADEAAEVAIEEAMDTEEDKKNWSLSASVGTRIYQGMFVNLENTDDNLSSPYAADTSGSYSRWSNVYSIAAGYKLDDFNFGARAVASHWLSRAGGINEPNEFRFQDMVFSAGWSGYNIEAIDTRFSAKYDLSVPTSTVSQTANLIVGNYVGLSLSRTFVRKLSLSYTMTGGWTPHSTTIATVDSDVAQIYREDELVGNEVAAVGGYNTEFSLSHSFSASLPVWDKLRASASYSYGSYWTYDRADADDEFSSDIEGIQQGRNYGDGISATAGLSYPINDHFNVSGGISTSQSPKTSDNKGFRFPWWNFTGAAANRSSINLTVSGTY